MLRIRNKNATIVSPRAFELPCSAGSIGVPADFVPSDRTGNRNVIIIGKKFYTDLNYKQNIKIT